MKNKLPKPTGLIWERLQPASESSPTLSRSQIVQAALALADAEGVESVTMRRIATQLNSAAMSLYRHITSKDDLLDLMLDEVFGMIALPDQPSRDWRAEYRHFAYQTRAAFKAHPWVIPLLNSRPTIGPQYLRWFEFSLAVAAPFDLDMKTTTQMVGVLFAYVLGVSGYESAEEENNRRTGYSDAEKHAFATPYVERLIASGRYPQFARFFAENAPSDPDEGFEFGLICLLDGFAVRLSSV